jgi:hypothetical protein
LNRASGSTQKPDRGILYWRARLVECGAAPPFCFIIAHAARLTAIRAQWIKNGIIFAPLIFDRQLLLPTPLLRTAAGFVLLCLLSSTVYLFNNLADLERTACTRASACAGRRPPASRVALAAAIALRWCACR